MEIPMNLTKRELFAAMAMQAVLRADPAGKRTAEECATEAVEAADALLAELGGDKAADIANVELRG
jgi:hypothetical protein